MSNYPNPNTTTSMEKSGKNIEEAVDEALKELGIAKADADIEIIQEPSKGFLGLGAKEAVVRVTRKDTSAAPAVSAAAEEQVPTEEPAAAAAPAKVYNSEHPEENAKNFVNDILTAMGLEVSITSELEGDMVKMKLEGENMGIVIGKRGDTLDSLQYLTSLVINQVSQSYIKVSIDTENYREKRSAALITLSNRLAQKVAKTGKKFALEPMNPYERRIIHANLQDSEEVTTYSVGQEPYRKVVIAPKNPRPYRKGYRKNDRRGGRPQRETGSGGYRSRYSKPAAEESAHKSSVTYKADFKPQQHKAEYKNFEEYLAAHSK